MKGRTIIIYIILFVLSLGTVMFLLRRLFRVDPQPYAMGLLIGFVVYMLLKNRPRGNR
jgi:cytosine/uracil/thiamine/allantoin permease